MLASCVDNHNSHDCKTQTHELIISCCDKIRERLLETNHSSVSTWHFRSAGLKLTVPSLHIMAIANRLVRLATS